VSIGQVFISTYAFRDNGKRSDGSQDTIKVYDDTLKKDVLEDVNHGTVDAESFAESIANNVFCPPGEICNLTDIYSSNPLVYNGKCTATYDWIKQNVFGGDDFFASSSDAGGDVAANSDNCGGAYTSIFQNSLSEPDFVHVGAPNFGDPNCKLPGTTGRNDFYLELQRILNGSTTKGKDGTIWPDWILFKDIIQNESGYNPNNYSYFSSANTCYGLYQMNPQSKPSYYRAGIYDIGDVNWPMQTYYAAMYNTTHCKFQYWSTSAHLQEAFTGFGYNPRPPVNDCIPSNTDPNTQPIKPD